MRAVFACDCVVVASDVFGPKLPASQCINQRRLSRLKECCDAPFTGPLNGDSTAPYTPPHGQGIAIKTKLRACATCMALRQLPLLSQLVLLATRSQVINTDFSNAH